MPDNDLLGRLTGIFQSLFGDETLSLSQVTTAKDVEGWDSLMHINLIVAVERVFKIRFTTREISELQNVGELLDLIARKQAVNS